MQYKYHLCQARSKSEHSCGNMGLKKSLPYIPIDLIPTSFLWPLWPLWRLSTETKTLSMYWKQGVTTTTSARFELQKHNQSVHDLESCLTSKREHYGSNYQLPRNVHKSMKMVYPLVNETTHMKAREVKSNIAPENYSGNGPI